MATSQTEHRRDVGDMLERLVEMLSTYASSVLTDRLLDEATGGELTPAQFDALTFVSRHDRCSVKALSEGLRISIPSATRLVDRLVRKGIVDRRESGIDRRLVQLTVTEDAKHMLQTVHQVRLARLRQALDTLTAAEREALLTLLERFITVAMRDERTVEDCCLHCGAEHDSRCIVNTAHIALVGTPIKHP